MDLKETIRDMVREEVAAALATLPAGPQGEKGDRGRPGTPGETPSIAHLEARVQDLVNSTESKVAAQLAAVRAIGGKE